MKNYRVRRPKQYDELLNLLKDKDYGVFSTLKSALMFSAAVGFKQGKKLEFSESGEQIALTLFNDHIDQPFIYSLALTEFNDIAFLREENFLEVIKLFEEYAAGGLEFLDRVLDKDNIKESIEEILADTGSDNLIGSIVDAW